MLQCYFLLLQVSQSQVGCSSVVCVCFHLTWGPGWRCNLYLGHAGLMAGAKKWCQCYTKTLKTCAWNLRKWLLVTWPWSKQVSQTSLCYQGGRCNPPPGRGTWKNSAICPEHRWVHTLQTFLQPSFFMEAHVFGHSPHTPPKKGLKVLGLYWQRIGKWTEVPLCSGLSLIINSLGLIKLGSPFPQRDKPCWNQSVLVIRANLSTLWSKFWL